MSNSKTLDITLHLAQAIKRQLIYQLGIQNINITPMHIHVMKIIYNQPSCTAQDIVCLIRRDKAQITRLIKGLISQGLVQKNPNPKDKRSQLLVLTNQGIIIQEKLLMFSEEMQKNISQGINEQDLETFIKVARRMTANLESSLSSDWLR